MLEIPKRVPLAPQVAGAIRKGIEDREWEEFLPGERRLSELFEVSRPTIRRALQLLAKEGILHIQHGKANRIRPGRSRSPRKHLVGIITTEPFFRHLSISSFHAVSGMRAQLAKNGFTTEVLVCKPTRTRAERRKVEKFIKENRVFCCVLISVSRELQQWFSDRSIPALVLGSCYPLVKLPSLDLDNRSICRHAAGILLGKGHRRIALITPDSPLPGDLASEQGFAEAVEKNGTRDAKALIVRHQGTARSITSKLDALFGSREAPTALIVAMPQHVFIVIIYLLRRGLAVPDTISLIARDPDYSFEIVSPPISHYTFDSEIFARRLSRLMIQLVSQGYLRLEPNLIIPRFFAGGTVKQISPNQPGR